MKSLCKCPGCDKQARYVKAGMCASHYRNLKLYGSPETRVRKRTPQAVLAQAALSRGMAAAVEVGECLEWQAYCMCNGTIPAVKACNEVTGKSENLSVPRLLWELNNGPIPDGKLIYRTCCNNRCVLHLACGTRKEWANAKKKAGTTKHSQVAKLHLTLAARRRSGTKNTLEKARQVRSLAAAKVSTLEISQLTGVHPEMVAEIRQGAAWREFGGNLWQGLGA